MEVGRLKGQGREKEEKGKEKGRERDGEKIPKQNRNCQCFGLFRFEPKEKKSVSQDTLPANDNCFQ